MPVSDARPRSLIPHRLVRYRGQRALAPGKGRAIRYVPSARKQHPANFACWTFSEVRIAWVNGRRPCTLLARFVPWVRELHQKNHGSVNLAAGVGPCVPRAKAAGTGCDWRCGA